MESIKKQSLPSNPTANAAPALAPAPASTATSQFPLSAHQDDTFVAPLVTLELSKQFGEWQQHLQHLPASTSNSRWSPFSAPLALPLFLSLLVPFSEPKMTTLPSGHCFVLAPSSWAQQSVPRRRPQPPNRWLHHLVLQISYRIYFVDYPLG